MIDNISTRFEKAQKCQICERECKKPKYFPATQFEEPVYMCMTCWAIWYDGCTDAEEIKRHSLNWPVDDVGAYCKSNYSTTATP